MKKALLFLFFFIFFNSFAQLDREHWFAPMMDRIGNSSTYQSIYISTNDPVPFNVDIYNNNVIVSSVIVSKNNPVKYSIPRSERKRIITTSQFDLFKPVPMGFYLKGDKPFFATLRFSIKNHGEIQTSKGTAGLGKEFRAVMAPISVNNRILSFMNSIMATEDSTNVTITDFKPDVQFSDYIPRTQINFTLNKGQSYIIDGTGDSSNNYTGYIGAKIVSDKPIVIANGNFNGQYAGDFGGSSDILMDQSVPIDKLGQEFVLMKGNGEVSSNMEKGLILATEDNTEIYINDGTIPAITLNAGEHYVTDNSSYIDQGSDHYNMFVKATKNIYLYQLLAGANALEGTEQATGGFNYVPPLNCYLPQRIDEIGNIDENEYSSNGVIYSLTVRTKLNIITERGATIDVLRNGISLPLNVSNGPFDVLGNANWVTYSIPNITGNIAIISSNAVTAGISAGNDAVGYGGYFAGFSSIPLIVKLESDCLPDVKLGVTQGFKSYLWLLKVGNTYIPAPGENDKYFYKPSQAGIYAVQVQQGSCTEVQTPDFKFFNCTTFTNDDYNICSEVEITPKFGLSSQTIKNGTVQIENIPTKGTVIIKADGKLAYTAYPNTFGIDTFKYKFCGIGDIPDCETVQATIHINQIVKKDAILEACTSNGIATYDLSLASVTANNTVKKNYYLTENGAENDIISELISNFANFSSADQTLYVRMVNDFGCIAIAKIKLQSKLPADVKPELYTKVHCDEDIDGIIDGIYKVDVQNISAVVLQNPADYYLSYYETEIKALAGLNDDIKTIYSFSANDKIWIRVEPKNGCNIVIREISLQIGVKQSITSVVNEFLCDDNFDGIRTANLSDYIAQFTHDNSLSFSYYQNLTDAKNKKNPIQSAVTITNSGQYYIRFHSPILCDEIGTLNLTVKIPKKSTTLIDQKICPNSTTTLDAGPNYSSYLWSTGETSQRIKIPIGEYWVDLTFDGCKYRQRVSVSTVQLPEIQVVEIQNGTVTILATGGNAPYQYSLDGYHYQTSNIFNNVAPGNYTVYIISSDLCDPVTTNIDVMQILNVITPNDDGKNDILDYSTLLRKDEPSLQIFDRHGISVFKGDKGNRFSWDGKVGGRTVSSGSYWYVLRWKEPHSETMTKLTGWILVKSR
ncbi:gliding motility-associated C-terminal domain-containing protein [Chryseobacterium sp. SNU WT5]|uniref:T9SS type B sorting domain-containing protein n=1 Tax=Chryseobacterium sp. SNU WT5 TaxID=2594269 RepID=UPI00117F0A91|nr:gliding motility-associated C-terminal domain-containing protein [Chryseobacterium sp. SNU WT5]QDP84701.1 gliding motility-associated C-terminal domain-containing protein [Chryseobacterium sp. SNU WT5]